MERITSNNITKLEPNQIFVFGSNLSGIHGAGAAKLALRWGAQYGFGVGLQGNTYAIPTKDFGITRTLSISEIKPYVDEFIATAKYRDDLEFLVTEVGCGLAGLKVSDVAPMFVKCLYLKNVYLPQRFVDVLL